ncbi:MAG: nitroreductase family protein [Bacteroidales bacterium]|nr:nitroreductase family protein [Bacteroidales bacterium]
MADNYLENRYDELFGSGRKKTVVKHVGQSLDSLLKKNRSYRGYDKNTKVSMEQLKKIVAVNPLLPSGRNQQALRFKLITHDTGAEKVLANIKLGGALSELHLPFEGTEPEAFIIICSTVPENKILDIDLGISAQSMLLKAVEMGLNGIMIGAYNTENIKKEFDLPYEPVLIVAIGKGAENIRLVEINEDESHKYYRQDGVHFVPKVKLEQLIL